MVKPGDRPAGPSTSSSSQVVSPDSGDFSFVVLDRSMESHTSLGNGVATNGSLLPHSINLQSMEETNLLTSLMDMKPEEVQKKLQDVLRENIELKETLQQNNLAMKQQFNTLITWQEDVARVHQNHKEKFEETRTYINKLKAENESLKMKSEINPSFDKVLSENAEFKRQLETLKNTVTDQDKMNKEKESLRNECIQLEQRLVRALEAQKQSEKTIQDLTDHQTKLVKDNEELKTRAKLLQSELEAAQADNFILVEHSNVDVMKETTVQHNIQATKSWSAPDVNRFLQGLDSYEERLMNSYQQLDLLVDGFGKIHSWLQRLVIELPSTSSALDMTSLQGILEDLGIKLMDSKSRTGEHRLRLEEASQQLGRLSSDFQGLLQEWLQLEKEKKIINVAEPQQQSLVRDDMSKHLKEQLDHMTAKLLETQEKLNERERALAARDASLAQLNSKLDKREIVVKEDVSKELKEKVDHMTAQLLEAQEKLDEHEKTLTARDASLAQLNSKLEKHDSEIKKAEDELNQALKKQKSLEANVDALQAQAEVYKMDFNEERESREKLATEKERVADDLRALQKRNQDLLDELKACQQQLAQAPQHVPQASGGSSRYSFNTIAAPGRGQKHQSPQQQEPERRSASPSMYECPKCQLKFARLEPLQHHVELCLDSDMFPY